MLLCQGPGMSMGTMCMRVCGYALEHIYAITCINLYFRMIFENQASNNGSKNKNLAVLSNVCVHQSF